jgi:hypothetical protein
VETLPDISELSPSTLNAVVAVGIGVGTLYCFLGYRTLRFVIGLTGFILAGGVAFILAAWLSAGHTIASVIVGAVGGLCGAVALHFLYKTGVFGLGLMAAGLIASNVLADRQESWIIWAVFGAAFGGGLLAILIERPVVTLATAAIGSWLVVAGITFFLMGPEALDKLRDTAQFEDERLVVVGSWAVLALLGAFAQFATHRPRESTDD